MFERTKNLLRISPRSGDGKDSAMGKQNDTATAPAASGAQATIDPNVLGDAIAKALAPSLAAAIGEANKPLMEAVGKLQPATPAAADTTNKDGAAKPLTLEDVKGAVGDMLKQQAQTAQTTAQRQAFIAERLK